jgi:Kdo2-lipid IVA lauroyltransferase/acyltransferase
MAFALRLLGLLPLPVLYAIGRFVTFVGYTLMRWHVPLATENLARALPERSPEERKAILDECYRNLGGLVAEVVWGWRASAEALKTRVTIDNRAIAERYIAERRNVVLLTAHVCNWEWLVLAACAELQIPICPVYKPLRVPSVDVYVREARARFGCRPIPIDNLLFELMRSGDEPRAFGMVADQTPPRDGPKHWRHFLNRDTAFYAGLGKVARFLDAPVIFVGMRRVRRGVYTAHLTVLSEPPYDDDPEEAIVDAYAACLEREIRSHPADWLWVHRKWKYPKPAEGVSAD